MLDIALELLNIEDTEIQHRLIRYFDYLSLKQFLEPRSYFTLAELLITSPKLETDFSILLLEKFFRLDPMIDKCGRSYLNLLIQWSLIRAKPKITDYLLEKTTPDMTQEKISCDIILNKNLDLLGFCDAVKRITTGKTLYCQFGYHLSLENFKQLYNYPDIEPPDIKLLYALTSAISSKNEEVIQYLISQIKQEEFEEYKLKLLLYITLSYKKMERLRIINFFLAAADSTEKKIYILEGFIECVIIKKYNYLLTPLMTLHKALPYEEKSLYHFLEKSVSYNNYAGFCIILEEYGNCFETIDLLNSAALKNIKNPHMIHLFLKHNQSIARALDTGNFPWDLEYLNILRHSIISEGNTPHPLLKPLPTATTIYIYIVNTLLKTRKMLDVSVKNFSCLKNSLETFLMHVDTEDPQLHFLSDILSEFIREGIFLSGENLRDTHEKLLDAIIAPLYTKYQQLSDCLPAQRHHKTYHLYYMRFAFFLGHYTQIYIALALFKATQKLSILQEYANILAFMSTFLIDTLKISFLPHADKFFLEIALSNSLYGLLLGLPFLGLMDMPQLTHEKLEILINWLNTELLADMLPDTHTLFSDSFEENKNISVLEISHIFSAVHSFYLWLQKVESAVSVAFPDKISAHESSEEFRQKVYLFYKFCYVEKAIMDILDSIWQQLFNIKPEFSFSSTYPCHLFHKKIKQINVTKKTIEKFLDNDLLETPRENNFSAKKSISPHRATREKKSAKKHQESPGTSLEEIGSDTVPTPYTILDPDNDSGYWRHLSKGRHYTIPTAETPYPLLTTLKNTNLPLLATPEETFEISSLTVEKKIRNTQDYLILTCEEINTLLKEPFTIPDTACVLIEKIYASYEDLEVFIVGGFIRDKLKEKEPKDIDIVVGSKGNLTTGALSGKLSQQGIHSMVKGIGVKSSIFITFKKQTFDVVVFNRGNVEISNYQNFLPLLKTYASNRDLTCNAIFYNPRRREFYDVFRGIHTLFYENHLNLISTDITILLHRPLFILKLIKLSAFLGYSIAPEIEIYLKEQLPQKAHYLYQLKDDRLYQEYESFVEKLGLTKTNELLKQYTLYDAFEQRKIVDNYEQMHKPIPSPASIQAASRHGLFPTPSKKPPSKKVSTPRAKYKKKRKY